MLDLKVDLSAMDQLSQAFEKVPQEVERILDRNITAAKREKDTAIQRTYSRPIPTVAEYNAKRNKRAATARKKAKATARREAREAKKRGETLVRPVKVKRPVKVGPKKPRTKRNGDQPAWVRTGAWKAGQQIERAPGVRVLKDTGKAAEPIRNNPGGYAERLSKLPISPDGKNRRNAAAETAYAITEKQFRRDMEQMVENLS